MRCAGDGGKVTRESRRVENFCGKNMAPCQIKLINSMPGVLLEKHLY